MQVEFIHWILACIGTYIFLVWYMAYLGGYKFLKKITKPKKIESISMVIPAYNEEDNIENAIESLLASNYPKNKLEIIVVDDGSTDRTRQIAEKYAKRNLIKLISQPNMGKGAALNNALKVAKGKLFGVIDADTVVEKDTLIKLVGFFNSRKVGAAISGIKPIKAKNILEKFQQVEYILSILIRKLMDKLETNYVTPGALSLYRKDVITKLGGFDENNITEDLEMGLRLRTNGYTIRASVNAFTYTVVPNTFRNLFKQRIRWNRGFLINVRKYKHLIFSLRHGYLSSYQIPAALIAALIIAPIGFGISGYSLYKTIHNFYLHISSVGLSMPTLNFPVSITSFLLSFNIKAFYPLFVTVFLTVSLIVLAQRVTGENCRNIFFTFLTIMVFYPILGIFWLTALFAEIFRIKEKW